MAIDSVRIRRQNAAPLRPERAFVLYWMTAYRRTRFNFALDRAVDLAVELQRPLVILEALRVDYRWASDRFHRFVADGMRANRDACRANGVTYHPYFEPVPGASKTLLADFSSRACAVVTDDFPVFFLPRMVRAAGRALDVRLEVVDSNGLLPMRAASKVYARAVDFRRFLQKSLAPHLARAPRPEPLQRAGFPRGLVLPPSLTRRWPEAGAELLDGRNGFEAFPVDHTVPPVAISGGQRAASERWARFLAEKLARYGDERNDPDDEVSSGMSPYLHWGHFSSHEIFRDLARREGWSVERMATAANGKRSGWWGMSQAVESFLDELVTWRELGFNMAWQRDDYAEYDSLPDWAQKTLADHASDPRPHRYELDTFAEARTHDEVWNAAQRQLVRDGRIHNYLRMLWGKKILEWTKSPREALEIMIELNNRYGVDGRDPNSYSGIFWVLGRYDRAWGPERPIFGKIRYMTSDSTRKKVRLRNYLRTYGPQTDLFDA